MKKIFSLLVLASLVMVACENTATPTSPTITITSGDVVEISAEGGEAEILFTAANGGDTNVNVSDNASWLEAKVSGDVVKLTAKANDTAQEREAEVTLRYSTATAKVTVKQAGSAYDVVFEAKRFEGVYFGTEYSEMHNYYIILSDIGVKMDASPKANGTYYFFDMYRNIAADETAPILPDGEYKYDTTNSYADCTFSEESSWYVVTGADGKSTKTGSFKSATISVKNGKFTASIELENGETHFVSYEGELLANTYITTFTEDVEFNVTDATVTAKLYGDTLNAGLNTWFIEAVKGNDYFCVEVIAESATSCDGIYQMLPADTKNYANTYIPGMLGEDGLVGTWYAKLTNNTIKGDVMAPICEGAIRIVTEGEVLTIEYGCKDDVGNNITGKVAGKVTISDERE